MTQKNEALRLADAQDCVTDDNCGYCVPCSVAAELRRLHVQRDALLEALKYLTEYAQQHGVMPVALTTARAAIKQAEENT